MPARDKACATATVILSEPGVSPWMQSVCALTEISWPLRAMILPLAAMWTACLPAASGSRISASSNGKAGLAKDIQHRRTGEANEHYFSAPSRDAFGNRCCELCVVDGLVVERAMWFYVANLCPQPRGDRCKRFDLFVHEFGDFLGRELKFDPAEIFAVGITRMGANSKAVALCLLYGLLHRSRVAGMTAAGDVP